MLTRFLAICRYLLIIPVIGGVIITAVVFLIGFIRIVRATLSLISSNEFHLNMLKKVSVASIEIIDLFLVGTVSYIVSIGLYKLFISKKEVNLPVKLTINNMAELENKIIGVLVAALAVYFLGFTVEEGKSMDVLYVGGGIAMVILALSIFLRYNEGTKKSKTSEDHS